MAISEDLSRELDHATTLAHQAGEIVLTYFRTRLAVDTKQADGSPVTRADRESEALILRGLRNRFPDDGILAEESAANASWRRRTWVVDPLDGTQDFVQGLDGFSVMIGLLLEGRPILGVVHQPTTGITYQAARGLEAWFLRHGIRQALGVSNRSQVHELRLVVSNTHRDDRLDAMKQALGIEDELPLGSVGLKAALVARAERDLYIHPSSHCKLWDICAPEAILIEAGGAMTDLHGAPLRYDPAELRVKSGILASNGRCHAEVVRRLAPVLDPATS